MATVSYVTCDRCGVQSTYHGVVMYPMQLGSAKHDVCGKCYDVIDLVMKNSIHGGLLVGAKALEMLQEDLGDDRMLELCGCSGSYLSDTLREIEEHMDE